MLYIHAGKTEVLGVKYSGMINDTLFFDNPSSLANRLIDINDFELLFSGSASPEFAKSKNSILAIENSFLAISTLEDNIVDTIPSNYTIDDKLNWANDTCIIFNLFWDASGSSSNTGLWNNVRNKYFRTKIVVDNKFFYGWIRVKITDGWNLTILDYSSRICYQTE